VTPGERIASIRSTRILFEDGVPLAVLEAGKVRPLAEYPGERESEIAARLSRPRFRGIARAEGAKQSPIDPAAVLTSLTIPSPRSETGSR
jgi:hypothetical protein